MAQKTVVTFVSDLSGTTIDADTATVRFGLDGATYEIDLTVKEQKTIRDQLAPYVDAARKVAGSRRAVRSKSLETPGPASPREIREWALANGHDVPARGRIPALVREAYDALH